VFGRDAERAQLEQALDRVPDGPTVVVLEGAAGIGKTALWLEGLASAGRRGFDALRASPGEPDAGLAFAGLGDLFDGLPADTLDVLADPQRRALAAALLLDDGVDATPHPQALGRAVLGVLRRLVVRAPLMVAIDDEQWLDPASARALGFALCRLRDEPIGVLLATRTDSPAMLYFELARVFSTRGLVKIPLGPLESDAIQKLLDAQLRSRQSRTIVRRITEAAGGNPLYALAIALELEGRRASGLGDRELPIPRSLADAIMRRLESLDERARDALLVMAATSNPTPALMQAALPDFMLSDLDAATAAGIVELMGGQLRFTHPLLASVHYAAAPPARRRELHRALAEAVIDEEERARHVALGAEVPDGEVSLTLERAAGAAGRRGAHEMAAQLLEEAARLTPAAAIGVSHTRLIAAAEHHFACGEVDQSRRLLETVVPELPHNSVRARALRQLALTSDDLDVESSLLEEALADAGEDHHQRARVEMEIAVVEDNRGRFTSALAHQKSAVESAKRTRDQGLLAQALAGQAEAAVCVGGDVQHDALLNAIEIESFSASSAYGLPTAAHGRALFWTDELDAARPKLQRAAQLALERGEEWDLLGLRLLLALLEWEAGDIDTAERYKIAVEADAEQYGDEAALWMRWIESWFAAGYGQLSDARASADHGLALAERIGNFVVGARLATVLSAVDLWTGEPLAAHHRLEAVRAALLAHGFGLIGGTTLSLWSCDVEALIAMDSLTEAQHVLDDLIERGRSSQSPHAHAIAERCQGLLLAARHDLDGAIDAMDTALREHARRPLPLELGRTLLEKGTLERQATRTNRARATLEQALSTLEPLRAEMWISRAHDQLHRIERHRSRIGADAATQTRTEDPVATTSHPDTAGDRLYRLSPRERELISLIAEGLTDAQIAQRLYISVKTVHSHLDRIRDKTGARRRAELTRLALLGAGTV
jgi:DNA-binding CsgD family transcriptional regulator/tetratricopeptide (TPR) repeat protein